MKLTEKFDHLTQLAAGIPTHQAAHDQAAAALRAFDAETNQLNIDRQQKRHDLVKAQHEAGNALQAAHSAAQDLATLKALVGPAEEIAPAPAAPAAPAADVSSPSAGQ